MHFQSPEHGALNKYLIRWKGFQEMFRMYKPSAYDEIYSEINGILTITNCSYRKIFHVDRCFSYSIVET